MITHPWLNYTSKLKERILSPSYAKALEVEENSLTRVVVGQEGSKEQGNLVYIYLLVHKATGMIEQASFQAIGETTLIAAADVMCELVQHKNYAQASRMSAELIDRKLRDDPSVPSFPKEAALSLNSVLSALMEATLLCQDIYIPDPYAHTPVQEGTEHSSSSIHYEHWSVYSNEEKIAIIKEVIAVEVAPYVALDEGGVEVKELKNDTEVIVAYQGACTTCFSATGSTLSAIQQILKDKVHPAITVVPDLSSLNFHSHV